MKKIKIGSDFSGVGAFNQALIRLNISYEEIFACDMDKYARQTFALNYGEPKYFPKNVYEREIPTESLDIYMTSPPCQAFSLAGKRNGEKDDRGILFYNSHEFIKVNQPRFFIIENVKGLLSDDGGKTFQRWIDFLGGKSVNGTQVMFPHEESVPYHVYYKILNAKDYNIPQNRERVFIVGIRDDADNDFTFPKPEPLSKRLKDVLEDEVDEKYFLSDKLLSWISGHREKRDSKGKYPYTENDDTSGCITARYHKMGAEDVFIGTWRTHEDGKGFREMEDNLCPTIPARAREDGSGQPVVKVNANFGNKRLNETLNTKKLHIEDCIIDSYNKTFHTEVSPCISTRTNALSCTHVKIGAIRGRNPENPKSRESGLNTEQMLEINEKGTSNAITTVQKDNVVVISSNTKKGFETATKDDSINFSVPNSQTRCGRVGKGVAQTLDTYCNQGIVTKQLSKQQLEKLQNLEVDENIAGCITEAIGRAGSSDEYISSIKRNAMITQRIRRLTPLECFKLMDFNFGIDDVPDFVWNVSDSQAYKQAGNSICVGVLVKIIERLKNLTK